LGDSSKVGRKGKKKTVTGACEKLGEKKGGVSTQGKAQSDSLGRYGLHGVRSTEKGKKKINIS